MNNLPRAQSKWGADWRQRERTYNWQHWLYWHKQLMYYQQQTFFKHPQSSDEENTRHLFDVQDDAGLACREDIHCSDDFVVPEDKKCLSKMGIWE